MTYLGKLAALSPEQRLHLFEILAHGLTVAARLAWAEPDIPIEERLEAMKQFNESLHRVTARVWVQRLNTHHWSDEDFLSLLSDTDASLPPKLRGSIAGELERSYAIIAN